MRRASGRPAAKYSGATMRVLVVEDEAELANAVAQRLRAEAFGVDVAATVAEARFHADVHPYDAIVLDRRLPDGEGLELCREWRAAGVETPILMLTALDAIDERVAGLEGGADDYLTKPFATEELVARVRTLLRRGPVRRQPVLEVGALRIEPARRRVRKDGVIVPLTAKEFALLAYLADRAGEVVDRFDVLEHCWDHAYEPESNVVDVHVGALRRKLGAETIETVRGASAVAARGRGMSGSRLRRLRWRLTAGLRRSSRSSRWCWSRRSRSTPRATARTSGSTTASRRPRSPPTATPTRRAIPADWSSTASRTATSAASGGRARRCWSSTIDGARRRGAARSWSTPPPRAERCRSGGRSASSRSTATRSTGSRCVRRVRARSTAPDRMLATIVALEPLAAADDEIRDSTLQIAGGALLLWLLTVVVGWLLAGRALRPAAAVAQREEAFLADAAHELRTPVAVIRARAEQALREVEAAATAPAGAAGGGAAGGGATGDGGVGGAAPAPAEGALRAIEQAAERASGTIADMLELARLDARRGRIEHEPLRLDLLLEQVAEEHREAAAAAGAELRLDSSAGETVVEGDERLLARALANLVENAIRYGAVGGEIALSSDARGRRGARARRRPRPRCAAGPARGRLRPLPPRDRDGRRLRPRPADRPPRRRGPRRHARAAAG